MTEILKLKSDYSQDAEYPINIRKSSTFLYTTNEYVEFKIKNTIAYISIPKMKYLNIDLIHYVQDLFEEKF